MDRGAWQATVHGAAKSWTWLSDYYLFFIISSIHILIKYVFVFIKFCFLNFLLTHGLFLKYFFKFLCVYRFSCFLLLVSSLITFLSENMLYYFNAFNFVESYHVAQVILMNVPCAWKIYKYSSSFGWTHVSVQSCRLTRAQFFFISADFSVSYFSVVEKMMLKFPAINLYSFQSISFCFMYFEALLFGSHLGSLCLPGD